METFFFFAINEYLILHILMHLMAFASQPNHTFLSNFISVSTCCVLTFVLNILVVVWLHLPCTMYTLQLLFTIILVVFWIYIFHVQRILQLLFTIILFVIWIYASSMCNLYSPTFCLQLLFSLSCLNTSLPCAMYTPQLDSLHILEYSYKFVAILWQDFESISGVDVHAVLHTHKKGGFEVVNLVF